MPVVVRKILAALQLMMPASKSKRLTAEAYRWEQIHLTPRQVSDAPAAGGASLFRSAVILWVVAQAGYSFGTFTLNPWIGNW